MAEINNPHDGFFKRLFSHLATMEDFIRHYLPAELVSALDLTTLTLEKESFIDPKLRGHFSDLLFRVRLVAGGDVYVFLLLEHKSAPDGWVAFQLLRYIMRLWEQRFDQGCEKLPLVVPIVFYHGKESWTISPRFSTLVERAGIAALSKNIPDFEYLLRDVSLRGGEEIKGGPRLRTGLSLMRYIFSDDLGQRLPAIFRNLREMKWADVLEYLQTLLAYLSKAGRKVRKEEVDDAMLELLPKEEIGTEAPFAQSWIQEGMEKGRKKGIEEGIEKGREEGVQTGQHLGMASLSLRLVQRRFGQVSETVAEQIRALPNSLLEEFGEALFDFASPEEMRQWLAEHSSDTSIG